MIAGVFTLSAFIGFLGVCAWAYSRRNRARFAEAEMLPLTDEPATAKPVAKSAVKPTAKPTEELPPCCRGGAHS